MDLLRKNKRCSGQVTTEFVIMLVLCLVLAFAVFALFKSVSTHGENTVEVLSYSVP